MLSPAPPVVSLAGVTRFFPPHTHALRGLSLDVTRGERLAIVGASGSGKSTLLNIMGLLDQPTTGRYVLNGVDATDLSERQRTHIRGRQIGFVFQSFHLVTHLTVRENVAMPLRLRPVRHRKDAHERVMAVIDELGLSHRSDAFPATLSGGEKQRVAVARALVTRPDLLLCDEPTGNLDTATGQLVLSSLLAAGGRAGASVVIVTHDPRVAAAMDRRVIVADGHVQP